MSLLSSISKRKNKIVKTGTNFSADGAADPGASLLVKFDPYLLNPDNPFPLTDPSTNPIVEMNEISMVDQAYDIYIIAYLPTGSIGIDLNFTNHPEPRQVKTIGGGQLIVRPLTVNFYFAGDLPPNISFDIWRLHYIYQELNPNVQGIIVNFNDEDPLMTRGTITTVMTT